MTSTPRWDRRRPNGEVMPDYQDKRFERGEIQVEIKRRRTLEDARPEPPRDAPDKTKRAAGRSCNACFLGCGPFTRLLPVGASSTGPGMRLGALHSSPRERAE